MKKLALLTVLFVCSLSLGTIWLPAVPYGTEFTFYFSVYQTADPNAFYETAPSSADDIHVLKDGGTAANPSNNVTDLGKSMSLVLTATEMQAKVIFVEVNDATSPKAYMDQSWAIPTMGNASSLIPATAANVTQWLGTAVPAPNIGGVPLVDVNLGSWDGLVTSGDLSTYGYRDPNWANWTATLATNLGTTNTTIATNLDLKISTIQHAIGDVNTAVDEVPEKTWEDPNASGASASSIANAVLEELVTDHTSTRWTVGWILKQIYNFDRER
jgi:hypothetical protein